MASNHPYILQDRLVDVEHEFLKTDQATRYGMVADSIAESANCVRNNSPILLELFDTTHAGGRHLVAALIDPRTLAVYIHVPPEPSEPDLGIKGGRFPTVCHLIELIVTIYKVAEQSYPDLHFMLDFSDIPPELYIAASTHRILVPLTI